MSPLHPQRNDSMRGRVVWSNSVFWPVWGPKTRVKTYFPSRSPRLRKCCDVDGATTLTTCDDVSWMHASAPVAATFSRIGRTRRYTLTSSSSFRLFFFVFFVLFVFSISSSTCCPTGWPDD